MPCTQFVFAPDAIWWLSFKPLAVDQTQLILGSCFHRDVIARDDFTQVSQAYFERWDTATPEDNAICEAQQLGSISDPTHQGRFGPEEGLVTSWQTGFWIKSSDRDQAALNADKYPNSDTEPPVCKNTIRCPF